MGSNPGKNEVDGIGGRKIVQQMQPNSIQYVGGCLWAPGRIVVEEQSDFSCLIDVENLPGSQSDLVDTIIPGLVACHKNSVLRSRTIENVQRGGKRRAWNAELIVTSTACVGEQSAGKIRQFKDGRFVPVCRWVATKREGL